MAETILTFDQSGGIHVDAKGYTGTVCAETTDKLLAGIGASKKAERKKPEYNMVGRSGARTGVAAKR